ncbi:LysM peptidoglycan-binding domain-containing protein [Thalassotalea marina]|uniref:Peptidoglycan-binding protein LysM n=1 Tax=Thalassotalea marina TaxID=1673741 RepID=A0A919BGT8_9GAMM|nr:LysM domain-containing protein [Thalassotalea marina]GHF90301.1 peptidoglycan-binding protein LysM [Thalassotalea marina]
MFKWIILALVLAVTSKNLHADELRLVENAPTSYVVVKGDTLWDISAKFLKDPWLWPKLWRINPEVENPHLIYPGDQLKLVYDASGQPMLVKGKPNFKLSPHIRTTLKDKMPIETISLETLAPFLNYDAVLSSLEVEASPYVLGGDKGHKNSMEGGKIYVTGDLEVGRSYAVYQKQEEIISPDSEEVLGYHARLVATGKAIHQGDMAQQQPSTIYVDNAIREIKAGYIVKKLDSEQMLPAFFTMQAANDNIAGQIIKSTNDVREFGKFEVVFIDKGHSAGVKQGDIFSISRKSPGVVETADGPVYTADASRWHRMATVTESDYDMPSEPIGKLMVFNVFEQVSMALVLKTHQPLRVLDTVASP